MNPILISILITAAGTLAACAAINWYNNTFRGKYYFIVPADADDVTERLGFTAQEELARILGIPTEDVHMPLYYPYYLLVPKRRIAASLVKGFARQLADALEETVTWDRLGKKYPEIQPPFPKAPAEAHD